MTRMLPFVALTAVAAIGGLLVVFGPTRHPEIWFTPDQLGDRLSKAQDYAAAAKVYHDPIRQGTALYRQGDFKAAAVAFGRVNSAEAAYNQGNSLVMLGKYDDAIKSYDRALSHQPDWSDAKDNRALAVIRRDRMQATGGDESGGKIDPDDVVFGKGKHNDGETVQVDAGAPMSDSQLRTMWLRRVQTKPADFLRAKFAFQQDEQKAGTP